MGKKHDPLDTEKTMMNLEDSLGDMPTMRLDGKSIGRVDRYELLEKLGEGGFGAVYGARDTEAGILVALKSLPSEVSRDAEEMTEIRDNFALVSRLHHPNIASVLHLHRVEYADEKSQGALGVRENDYLVVMEYAPGATLFAMRRALPGQKMDLFQALEFCRPIAEALDYAHSQKVLHRDVKPKNIMVEGKALDLRPEAVGERASSLKPQASSLSVKVLDFGLAAEIRSSMSRKSKEPQNSKSGTPLYMAPEQWAGQRQDGRADQYALAAMLYELVGGEVPFKSAFDSGNFEIMRSVVLNDAVEPLKELTKKQNAVLLRALAKKPEERFGRCGDFVAALGGGRINLPRKNAKGTKKGKWVVGLVVVGLLVGGALFGVRWLDTAFKQRTQQEQLAVETQAQVSTLLSEARTALNTGDLDVATEKAQAILQLAKGHTEAQSILSQVERRSSERDARTVKIDAELAFEKLGRDITDRGQGFEQKFEALNKDLLIAQDAYEHSNWGQAFTAFTGVSVQCTALRSLEGLRLEALGFRAGSGNSRKGAEGAEAGTLAKKDFEKGVASALRADQAFDAGQFKEASKDWKQAAVDFGSAQTFAVSVTAYGEAKTAYEKAIHNTQYAVADLRKHGGSAWTETERSARLGEASEKEPAQGRKHYETALAKYAEAAKTAEPHLVPQLKVVCSLSGVASVLRTESGRSALRADATGWKLEKDQRYTLEVSNAGYKTHTETLTANWHGLKEQKVVLEKWNGPEEGRKWSADLGSGVKMDFMPIKAGSFQMGSNTGDSDEKPVHHVTLSKPFWLAKTEVTQAQYQKIMGSNPSSFKGDSNPVEKVSWNDAVSFCKKLTERERKAGRLSSGFEYTLPTEAQWEYACRAGTTGGYAGNLNAMGWYDSNSGRKTHPVGKNQANAWGLYDMHGNVWEWCLDHCEWKNGVVTDTYRDGAVDPVCRTGSSRVNRGGSWSRRASYCRSAGRYSGAPSLAASSLGFRPLVQRR